VLAALVLAFAIFLGRAVADEDDATALVLGVGLIPFATELTCYYYSFMLAYALLWSRWRPLGVVLIAVSLLTSCLVGVWFWEDDLDTAISVLYLAFIVVVTWRVTRARAAPAPPSGPQLAEGA